jgi:hypothetical protein
MLRSLPLALSEVSGKAEVSRGKYDMMEHEGPCQGNVGECRNTEKFMRIQGNNGELRGIQTKANFAKRRLHFL